MQKPECLTVLYALQMLLGTHARGMSNIAAPPPYLQLARSGIIPSAQHGLYQAPRTLTPNMPAMVGISL